MGTPPDGRSPQMQMFLQHQPFTSYPGGDPFSPTNVGDEADTVYHEYTHGLSNRLNVDVQGRSTLGGVQAGAMGEAWSDWYAMDYLVDHGLQRDRAAKADVRLFLYDGQGVNFDRTEPIDCKVGQTVRLCNGGATGHPGGYTYQDYSHVGGGPEVHSDGEIWAQTLWSLRHAIGSKRSEALVTRAMELAPYNPSFLDMRNAILVADTSLFQGRQRAQIWKVFASRGMGFFAGSLGAGDSKPGASFATPPAVISDRRIHGTVTDADTGSSVPGVTVTLAFQGAGLANPTAVTQADGSYEIQNVPEGTYTKLQVRGAGYSGSPRSPWRRRRHRRLRRPQEPGHPGVRRFDRLADRGRVPRLQPAAGGRPEPGHRVEHQHRSGYHRRPQRHLPPQELRGPPQPGVRRQELRGGPVGVLR